MSSTDYPEQYQHDSKVANMILTIDSDQKAFEKWSSGKYTQLNFPYNNDYITKIKIGNNGSAPSGTPLRGMHTLDTCAMNASLVYNKNNSVSLGTTYVDDIMCKITSNSTPIFEGLYSKVNASLDVSATSYNIVLSGLMLPDDGDRNGQIELANNYSVNRYKTMGVWIGIKPETCTPENAFLYYENGALKTKILPKFLILKNTFIPFVIKYTTDDKTAFRLYPESDGATKIPFVLKSITKQILYSIKTTPNGDNTGNLVYYNFQESSKGSNLGKCTIYNSSTLTSADKNLIENSENYETLPPKLLTSFQLSYGPTEKVEFVGLNETGTLTTYYLDSTTNFLKSRPVKDAKEVSIEAKNKGSKGINKKDNYSMVLDDSLRKMSSTKRKFAFPIENLERSQLIQNEKWMKTETHYLESINNSGQKSERGILMPSMKITQSMPLFSKNYKLQMALEKKLEDEHYYLRVYGTFKNNNSIYSVIPDFKMGQLFVADENATAKTMYLVKDANKTTDRTVDGKLVYSVNDYNNFHPPKGYTSKDSEYSVFDKVRDGYCKEKARGKSHFFVIEKKSDKPKCVIPKNSNKEILFLPKQLNSDIKKSTLYVPNMRVTSGNVEIDKKMGVNKYNYLEDAYVVKPYADYKISSSEWNSSINLSEQNTFFNQTNNYVKNSVGINSQDISKDTAEIMLQGKESFQTITDATLNQLNNYILPKANSYATKQAQVNKYARDISNNIVGINAKYGVMSDTVAETRGVQNNKFYDFTGPEIYSLKEDRSLTPALLKDQQTMAVEHNNLLIIGTITLTTLVISAVFVSSSK
jgi:hypothetical protein